MLIQQDQIIIDNINATTKSISINKFSVILSDGVKISQTQPLTCAFLPGQIEDVKVFTGWNDETPEVIYLNSVWTSEVIAAYQNLLNQD